MGLKVKVGVIKDKKNGKVYKPGEILPGGLLNDKAAEAAIAAGTVVEVGGKPGRPVKDGDK